MEESHRWHMYVYHSVTFLYNNRKGSACKKVQNFLKFYLKKSVLNVLIAEGQLAFWKGTHYVYDSKICFCNR